MFYVYFGWLMRLMEILARGNKTLELNFKRVAGWSAVALVLLATCAVLALPGMLVGAIVASEYALPMSIISCAVLIVISEVWHLRRARMCHQMYGLKLAHI